MAGWRHGGWLDTSTSASRRGVGCLCNCIWRCARELLSSYFPTGVPGYGTAPGVTVASRERPDFDPLGTRIGSFMLRPQVEEGLGYDDNVFGASRAGSAAGYSARIRRCW